MSLVVDSIAFGMHTIDVVEHIDDAGEPFFDLFDADTGECLNEGVPLYDRPVGLAGLPNSVSVAICQFYKIDSIA